MVVRCVSKVVDAYKLNKKVQRTFKKHGSIAYDSRILTYFTKRKEVSIWILGLGRTKIPYVCGKRQERFLTVQQGESDLVYYKGEWFLNTTCNLEEPEQFKPEDVLGVDLGVTNIAVTSDGKRVSSKMVEDTRIWYQERRNKLQAVGTKSSKRRLKQLSGRQARFQKDVNHRISKELVLEAKRTKRAIALEDLTDIRSRTRVRGSQNRAKHSNWSFWQLRSFISYKAKGLGVPVILIDPAYTSQRCNVCGHTEKANRKSQSEFKCCACHHEVHADISGARNIRTKAQGVWSTAPRSRTARFRDKPLALAGGS